MRQRPACSGLALCTSLALWLAGCASKVQAADAKTAAEAPSPAPGVPGELALSQMSDAQGPPVEPTELRKMHAQQTSDAAAEPSAAPGGMAPEAPRAPGNPGWQAPQSTAAPRAGALAPSREMLDIEASIELKVASVKEAVKRLHALAARVGGVVTAERVDHASTFGTATLTLRVPSSAAKGVFDDLDQVGEVLNQSVTARDVSKEYFDTGLRLSSLETTLHRYEEILSKAGTVEEILRIEQELARLRGEIEQLKGNLRWLADRAARATLRLTLSENAPALAEPAVSKPKFFPGLRLPLLVDFGKAETRSYGGGGVSIRFMHELSLDLDVLERFDSETRGPDALVLSAGGNIYSDLLGGGKRRFLNPYLGWRAGYTRFERDDQALIGASLGLELYKNRWFIVDVEARNYFAFGDERGGHYLLLPALAAGVAF